MQLRTLAVMPGGMMDMVLSTFFINILSLAMPLVLLQIYDRIVPNNAAGTLSLLIIGVGSALILEGILRVARSFVSAWMGARFDHLAGCSAVDRLLNANLVEYERQGSGAHLERLQALTTLREFYSGQAILNLLDLPFAVLFIGVMAYLAGWLAWVPIVIGLAFLLSALMVGKKLRAALEGRSTADDRRFNFIIEVLGNIHTLKSMAMEEQMLRRYERLQEGCATWNHDVALQSARALSVGSLFSQLTQFAVVGFGSTLVIDGSLTVGGLAACTMLAGRAMSPLQKAVGMWTRYQTIRLARERVHGLFEIKPESQRGLPEFPQLSGDIELRNVTFNYGKTRDGDMMPDIVKNVSLRIRQGEAIGISGGNVSGKTTLLYLLMGALKPVEGQVLIDGLDLSEFDPVSVRSQIGYLPQEAALFNGTLLENITMFRPDREEGALEIARYLGLDNVVSHMPYGYDTKVGEGGSDSLPRGIKQRIAIARALVDRPRLVLFDEANTAMDGAGDTMLRNLLEQLKGRVTLVLVSCRPSLLKLADQVYDLQAGVLVPRVPQEPPAAPVGGPIIEVRPS
ncbi:MAG: peptidase domain-containing ABC transporter [Magnetospirillum sp. WYHS-4]